MPKWIKPDPTEIATRRYIRKFLWFPTCIDNDCRWLCWAKIHQIYDWHIAGYTEYGSYSELAWQNAEWVDD